MNDISQGAKGIMVAAMVGAAVGAGVALLWAPCSGRETRGWLADKTRDVKRKTASVIEQGQRVVQKIGRDGEDGANVHGRDGHTKADAPTMRL